ncbi:hypothetical protein BNATCHR1117 (nucleomorph) [Bigelowiella natans]|uniref:Uncharacterized protein n=1 Tax=Bigelowiella natans TaxID=227086 RepID=Q3LWC8_BIGNA|nr:hypothetical protein BNATCHR1117 [Bigelowiella natans]ABA27237.1 hypothetical protein [Bigelowiella natans]|mmetsp:Transcript_14355/g.17198  ORF Transcript_14355/g.17198 Transcript_14355/m.17198 type:complete len:116 (-) Transcript_14355:370-717(-)
MKHWINFVSIETSKNCKHPIETRIIKLNDITQASKFMIPSLNKYIFIKTQVQMINLKYIQKLHRFKTMYYVFNAIKLNLPNWIHLKTFLKHFCTIYLLGDKRKRVILSKASVLFF